MRNKRSKQFNRLFDQLPVRVQRQAEATYQLFKRDPYHPSLHFKRVNSQDPVYSVRIGKHYRALGLWEGDMITWYWIGSHEDYNKVI